MSTRGYVTLIDEDKNILLSAYLSSDAYPSYYGLEVLEALQEGQLPSYIRHLHSIYPEDVEMVDGITRDWYIKRKGTEQQFFVDYVYEFDPSTEKLNLYYFGEKALTIPTDEIPFYRKVFEWDSALTIPLEYDPASCMRKKHFYPELRRILKNGATLEDLRALSEQPILYLERYRLKGYGWNDEDFSKKIYDSGSGQRLTFHASCFNGRTYSLYIQTPFYRAPLSTRPLLTPGAVEKELARLIHDRPADLRGTMALFEQIETYKQAVSKTFEDAAIPYPDRAAAAEKLLDDMLAELQKAHKQCSLLGCSVDSITRQLREFHFRTSEKARKQEEPEKPALAETIASAESQPATNGETPQDIDRPELSPEL